MHDIYIYIHTYTHKHIQAHDTHTCLVQLLPGLSLDDVMCVCVCACVHTCIHTYMHTYIHIQAHDMHTCLVQLLPGLSSDDVMNANFSCTSVCAWLLDVEKARIPFPELVARCAMCIICTRVYQSMCTVIRTYQNLIALYVDMCILVAKCMCTHTGIAAAARKNTLPDAHRTRQEYVCVFRPKCTHTGMSAAAKKNTLIERDKNVCVCLYLNACVHIQVWKQPFGRGLARREHVLMKRDKNMCVCLDLHACVHIPVWQRQFRRRLARREHVLMKRATRICVCV